MINLKVKGEDMAVTNDNRTEFVQLYVDYLLNTSIARQFDALSRGFHKVILHQGLRKVVLKLEANSDFLHRKGVRRDLSESVPAQGAGAPDLWQLSNRLHFH